MSNPGFAFAGMMFCLAAVFMAIGGETSIAMMFVAIGMMFTTLSY